MYSVITSPLEVAAASTDESFASFDVAVWVWFALVGAIVLLLVVDLLLVHRTAHVTRHQGGGHGSIRTTYDWYAHLFKGHDETRLQQLAAEIIQKIPRPGRVLGDSLRVQEEPA